MHFYTGLLTWVAILYAFLHGTIQVSTNINKNTHPFKPYSQSVSQLLNSRRHLSNSYDPMVQVSTNYFGETPGTLCIGASFS